MNLDWDDGARAELERWLAQEVPGSDEGAKVRRALLRAEVEEGLRKRAKVRVTSAELGAALAALPGPGARLRRTPRSRRPREGSLAPLLSLLAVCILPALCLAIESASHTLREFALDPIPSAGHVLSIALVCVAGGFAWYWDRLGRVSLRSPWKGFLVGFGLPIALVYFVVFLPLAPIGVIALAYMGLGIFVLAPLFCLPALARLASRLWSEARAQGLRRWPGFWAGVAVGTLFFAWIEWSPAVSLYWLRRAASPERATRAAALEALRQPRHELALRRAASGWERPVDGLVAPFLIGVGAGPGGTRAARETWYRIQGEPFDDPVFRAFGFLENEWNWQADGGELMGPLLAELELAASRLDGIVEADSGVAYLEWTLEFRNDAQWELEARALVGLPEKAVVSRLSLWIDGEEREAAYGAQGRVREAYEAVAMRERRDPALVTECQDDGVLLQCFPVPAGGSLRVKLGITAPLELGRGEGRLTWPLLAGSNFTRAAELSQALEIRSNAEILATDPGPNASWRVSRDERGWRAEGELSADALGPLGSLPALVVALPAMASVAASHPADPHLQLVCAFEEPAPRALPLVVLEPARALRASVEEIARVLEELFAGAVTRTWIVGAGADERVELPGEELAQRVRGLSFEGGLDASFALEAALAEAAAMGRDVLWISAPQPLRLSDSPALAPFLAADTAGTRLLCWMPLAGENAVLRALAQHAAVDLVQGPEPGSSLARALGREAEALQRRWSVHTAPAGVRRGSDHLTPLWALHEVERLLGERPPLAPSAGALASDAHIVSAVSGAVVLESAEQFREHGLEPALAAELPSVPEPELVLLLVMVLLAAGLAVRRGPA